MLLKWNREEINNLVRNTLINCKTMRKKNVLMSAIAALAFAACSSDDVLLEQDTGIVTNPTGNAWVALDIKTPSVSRSRALHDPIRRTVLLRSHRFLLSELFFLMQVSN